MSNWIDLQSLEHAKKLRDMFGIKLFVETGTFQGNNAEVQSKIWDVVVTIEALEEYYTLSKTRLLPYANIYSVLGSSPDVLKQLVPFLKNAGVIYFYLDAHFYDPNLPPEDRWVVLKELKALEGFGKCVIVIHDVNCNGLGHLVYDGKPLDFNDLKQSLNKVYPNFHYYFNTKSGCDIITKERVKNGIIPHITLDVYRDTTLDYVWSAEQKAYRGMMYAVPEPLDLNDFKLIETYE